jgi:hypothetical protein
MGFMKKNTNDDDAVIWISGTQGQPVSHLNDNQIPATADVKVSKASNIRHYLPHLRDLIIIFVIGLFLIGLFKWYIVATGEKYADSTIPLAVGVCFAYGHEAASGIVGDPVLCTDPTADYVITTTTLETQACPKGTIYTLFENDIQYCLSKGTVVIKPGVAKY